MIPLRPAWFLVLLLSLQIPFVHPLLLCSWDWTPNGHHGLVGGVSSFYVWYLAQIYLHNSLGPKNVLFGLVGITSFVKPHANFTNTKVAPPL